MKKSQLKNIIREEIKILQEQPTSIQPFPVWNDFILFTNNTPGLAFSWGCTWWTPSGTFSTMRMWAYDVLLNPIYNPNNTGQPQPCQHIATRITNFTNLIAQAGPNSQSVAMWQCKLDFYIALGQFYNC